MPTLTWCFFVGKKFGSMRALMTILIMTIAIILGSLISLVGGALLLKAKKYRETAILLAMPFGAGALLAAAFFDLLPESFEDTDPKTMLLVCLTGFVAFFLFERLASWFHHHHQHEEAIEGRHSQRWLIILGDIMHNAIDGMAIGAAFLVSIPTGIITTFAVGAHEIPKELGTFAFLLSRGWRGKTVIIANLLTAIATIVAAVMVYILAKDSHDFVPIMLALTSGFFLYVAASDIIPDIHEQPRRIGTVQALMLLIGVILIGIVITMLGV
jgi:zinc and cadmium transporter